MLKRKVKSSNKKCKKDPEEIPPIKVSIESHSNEPQRRRSPTSERISTKKDTRIRQAKESSTDGARIRERVLRDQKGTNRKYRNHPELSKTFSNENQSNESKTERAKQRHIHTQTCTNKDRREIDHSISAQQQRIISTKQRGSRAARATVIRY